MLGAIAGDVVGSVYEFEPIKTTQFPLFGPRSAFTDDTVLTCAVAEVLLGGGDYAAALRSWGRRYPGMSWGVRFRRWLLDDRAGPYRSFGNGSAMRVGPVGWACGTIEDVLAEAERTALPTHDHREGIKGAPGDGARRLPRPLGRRERGDPRGDRRAVRLRPRATGRRRPAHLWLQRHLPGDRPRGAHRVLRLDRFRARRAPRRFARWRCGHPRVHHGQRGGSVLRRRARRDRGGDAHASAARRCWRSSTGLRRGSASASDDVAGSGRTEPKSLLREARCLVSRPPSGSRSSISFLLWSARVLAPGSAMPVKNTPGGRAPQKQQPASLCRGRPPGGRYLQRRRRCRDLDSGPGTPTLERGGQERLGNSSDSIPTQRAMTSGTWIRRSVPPALQHRDFALLWAASLAMGLGSQMAAVIIGWQVYDIRQSAFDLGLIGLAGFVPLPLLALPAGHLADRFPRRLVFAGALMLNMAVMAALVAVTLAGGRRLWPFVALAAATGVANAIGSPAARALPPTLVPTELLAGAMALRTMGMQMATVAGPALGGFIFYVRPELPYARRVRLDGARSRVRARPALALRPHPRLRRRIAGLEEPARRGGLRPPHAGAARRDLARPLRGAVRRPDRARSPVRPRDPPRGDRRTGPAPGRARPRSRCGGRGAHAEAVDAAGGADAFPCRRRVRREHDRVRRLALVPALPGGDGGERLRGHDQHEHPRHDRRARNAERTTRAGERRGDGVHQRVQPARRVRVGRGGRTARGGACGASPAAR